jgi:hypothetical protein
MTLMEDGTQFPDEQQYVIHNVKAIIQILTELLKPIPSPKSKQLLHESCRFLPLGRYDHQLKMYHHFCPVH